MSDVSASWPPTPAEADTLREGLTPHRFNSGALGFMHYACVQLVERHGAGEDCGLPPNDPIHRRG